MDDRNLIRLLKADEIECRVAVINEKGLSLLLYKDARVDQKILDETFGAFGWKRSHQCIDGKLYCTVEIFNRESGEWVSKQDVGTTGYAEKEKSQASDSFKRACFNWGIGRELYSAPFIWISADKAGIRKQGDKYVSGERFTVSTISYNDSREITALEIVNSHGQTVYTMYQGDNSRGELRGKTPVFDTMPTVGKKGRSKSGVKDGRNEESGISGSQEIVLMTELNRTGVTLEDVLKRYGIDSFGRMTPEIYNKAIAALKQTKPINRTTETVA